MQAIKQPPAQVEVETRVAGLVSDALTRKGLKAVGPDDKLGDAGLSSLDLVNLMLAVEDAFDLALPEDKMTPENFRTVRAIETLIASLL